jgi:transcriptional regulator with XRE-family HTH domain
VWYSIGYHGPVNAAASLKGARIRAGLSVRELARRAATSHSTILAYEGGRKIPSVETFDRVMRAAGFAVGVELTPAVGGPDPAERGDELVEVLHLAARFPARLSPTLDLPRFGPA